MWKCTSEVFFACFVCDLMTFLLQLYFENVPSHISYLYWFMMSLSLMPGIKRDVYHFFGNLWALFHFSVCIGFEQPVWPGTCSLNCRNATFFFSVSWLLVIVTLPCDTRDTKRLHYWSSCLHDSDLTFALKEYVGENRETFAHRAFPFISPDS